MIHQGDDREQPEGAATADRAAEAFLDLWQSMLGAFAAAGMPPPLEQSGSSEGALEGGGESPDADP